MMSYGWLIILIIMICFVIITSIYIIDSIYSESNVIHMPPSITKTIYTSKDRTQFITESYTVTKEELEEFEKTGWKEERTPEEIKDLCNMIGIPCDLLDETIASEVEGKLL